MNHPVPIPYYAPDDTLPCPLPTRQEILHSSEICNEIGGSKVVRVGEHYVVKYGGQVEAIEGQNMLFVRQETPITVPQDYAIYTDTEPEVWGDMTCAQKETVTGRLREYIQQLRKIPSPGYYGSLGESHLRKPIFWTGAEGSTLKPAITGPFATQADMNEGMVQKYLEIADGNRQLDHKGEFYRRCLPRVLRGHPPVFTHGDLQRKNIIVGQKSREQSAADLAAQGENLSLLTRARQTPQSLTGPWPPVDPPLDGEDDYHVTLIDWEVSGWYPSYWEYSSASFSFSWRDDWEAWIERILEPYYTEYPWMQMLRSELWS